MTERRITSEAVEEYREYLYEREMGRATIEKYLRDLKVFRHFLGEEEVLREQVLRYKQLLEKKYRASSVNSMLAALNRFFQFSGWNDCIVKQVRIQRNLFLEEEKMLTRTEYEKLLEAAGKRKNERLFCLMQAICSTGIRVSEHRFITVEALKKGRAQVWNKGKERVIFLPEELCGLLQDYCRSKNIKSGSVFVTRNGKPLDRSNIWAMMKRLCVEAGVDKCKVFPHNLRHLFAFTFYSVEKDLVRLADVLGHSNMETTRIYTASTGREHRQQLSRMNLVLRAAVGWGRAAAAG